MILNLTGKEITEFRYILPIQGSLKTLELVQRISDKMKVNDLDEEYKVDFETDEVELIKQSIEILNQRQELQFTSLSLIHKILKQETN